MANGIHVDCMRIKHHEALHRELHTQLFYELLQMRVVEIYEAVVKCSARVVIELQRPC